MKWLFVTTRFPWPCTSGTWLRVYHQARELVKLGQQVTILSRPSDDPDAQAAYQAIGVDFVPVLQPKPTQKFARSTPGIYVYDPPLGQTLATHAAEFDVAILINPAGLQYAPDARNAKQVVADLGDDPFLEEWRKYAGRGSALQQWAHLLAPGRDWLLRMRFLKYLIGLRVYERTFLSDVDRVVMVSSADRDSYRRRHPELAVSVVLGGVDVSHYTATPPLNEKAATPTITFSGNYAHHPNAVAAEYLLRDVWPRIIARRPEARCILLGVHPTDAMRQLAAATQGVEITGWVEDLRDYLGRTNIVMLPMRTGTGVKNKLLEAWAARRPVITTALATQGVDARDGENLLIADTPDELADATIALLDDTALQQRLIEDGYATVCRDHDWPRVAEQYRDKVFPAIPQISYKNKRI